MGKSKKIRGGQGNRGALGALSDGIGIGAITDAAVGTTAAAIRVGESGAKVASTTFDTVTETNRLAQQVAKSSSLITEKSGLATAQSLESLTTQIGNASDNVTALSKLSEQSLTKLAPGASDTVGNIGTLSGTLTSSINKTVTLGSNLIDSILTILTLPFSSIKSKIDKMNAEKPDATQKYKNFNEIKDDILKDFTKISNDTRNNFKLQIESILKTLDNFITLLKNTCPKSYYWYYNCNEGTNILLDKIRQKQLFLIEKKSRLFSDIDGIFNDFNSIVHSIHYEDGDLNQLYKTVSVKQSDILTAAMDLLSSKIKEFNEAIDSIEKEVITFIEQTSSAIAQTPSIEQEQPSIGGRKTKKRKTKKSKSKKSKTRKSKK